jgi:hypothetical protein
MVTVREKHGGKCGGAPEVPSHWLTMEVDLKTGIARWDTNDEMEMKPIPSMKTGTNEPFTHCCYKQMRLSCVSSAEIDRTRSALSSAGILQSSAWLAVCYYLRGTPLARLRITKA